MPAYLMESVPYEISSEPVGLRAAYKSYWKNAFNFRDRTSLTGFWWAFMLNSIIVICLLVFAYLVISGAAARAGHPNPLAFVHPIAAIVIFFVWPAITIVPSLALVVRRLHDTGRSGFSYLVALIPVAGALILVYFLASATKNTPGNRYRHRRQV